MFDATSTLLRASIDATRLEIVSNAENERCKSYWAAWAAAITVAERDKLCTRKPLLLAITTALLAPCVNGMIPGLELSANCITCVV